MHLSERTYWRLLGLGCLVFNLVWPAPGPLNYIAALLNALALLINEVR
jgi:uncharacterized protein YhhL (DUF1145 family)